MALQRLSATVAVILAAAITMRVYADPAVHDNTSHKPLLTFEDDRVVIRSVPPGGTIALVSVAREPARSIVRVVLRQELLTDVDGDGVIVYPLERLARRSVWLAVDVATGAAGVASPAGDPILMRPAGAGEGVPVQAVAHRLEVGREQVTVLLVRPGVGAWARVVRDGNDADRDGRVDGRLRLDPSRLTPLHTSFAAAPVALKPGDVLAVLDAERLEYWYGQAGGDA